jgi:VWFA-related protein
VKVFGLLLLIPPVLAQQAARFTSEVQLVPIDVQATEKDTGRILDLLSPKDFVIYDEGQPREIRLFQFGTTPLDLVFLTYGKSGWGSPKDLQEFNRGLNGAAAEMITGDRAAVLRTDSPSQVDLFLTADQEAVRHALVLGGKFRTRHDRLYDAVRVAIGLFPGRKDPGRRRAIVAITDDLELRSKASLDKVVRDLLEGDIALNEVILSFRKAMGEIGFGGTWGIPRIRHQLGTEPNGASLLDAVEATGGEAIVGDQFQERFPKLLRQIRMRYLLGFYAPPASARQYRRLEVRLTPEARRRYPNAIIRARRGYYSVAAGIN